MSSTYLAIYGGLLLGVAVTILLLFNGRITGVSGILHNAVDFKNASGTWEWLFVLGLLLGGLIGHFVFNISIPTLKFDSPVLAIIAGLLVGYGTRLCNGCTSGHGICGISRLSLRSLVSTGAFMLFGFLTVALMRLI